MSKYKGKAKVSTTTTLRDVIDNAQEVFDIPERGISVDTVKHFGIRRMMNVITNEVDAYFFPLTKKGDTVGFIKVNLNRSKKNGRFTTIGDASMECDLIGQNVATAGKKLFITEGCFDLLSAYQSINNNKPNGFHGIPAVVSPAFGIGDINSGVTNSRQHIAANIDFVNQYKEQIVCFDNDNNTPENVGQEGVQDLALILKEFKNVVLPVNDCNDMMREHGEEELYWAFMRATTYENEHIVTGGIGLQELLTPLKTGLYIDVLPKTSKMLRGFREREMTIILAPTGVGKAQRIDEPVLMADGSWKTIGSLHIGDSLSSTDGCPNKVEGVYPQGIKPMNRVTFTDGSSTTACDEHLWECNYKEWSRPKTSTKRSYPSGNRVLSTSEIKDKLKLPSYQRRLGVPLFSGRYGKKTDNFITHRMMGLLLGDGSFRSGVAMHSGDDCILKEVKEDALGKSHTVRERGISTFITCKGGTNKYITELKRMGLYKKKSHDKFIPQEYMAGSYEQRFDLLSGLMDTDGTVSKSGNISYSTVSVYLRDDIIHLVRSLGGTANFSKKQGKYKDKEGNTVMCRMCYNVTITHASPMKIFRLNRKLNLIDMGKRKSMNRRKFSDIKYIGDYPAVCIKVSHPDSLYITTDFIVTHNTTICKEIGYSLVKGGHRVGHVFLEEDLKKTQQSYIALDNMVHLPKFREDPTCITNEQAKASYDSLINTSRTMWMNHFGSLSPSSLMAKFEWMAIKGMEYIILDHISMVFSGNNSGGNERKEIDLLLTELAAFTTKTGVHPIIVSHVKRTDKRPKRDKEGNIQYPYWDVVDSTQARGSGAFEQMGWNIIGIEPEILDNKTRGRIRTTVLKNREWGNVGVADVLTMSPQTGRMIEAIDQNEDF